MKENITRIGHGSKLEVALLRFLEKKGFTDYDSIRDQYKRKQEYKIFDFTSNRKASSAVISLDMAGKRKRVYVKGTAMKIINCCTHFQTIECEKRLKTSQMDDEMRSIIKKFNKKSFGAIAIAYRDLPIGMDHLAMVNDENAEPMVEKGNLTLIAIIAIQDPLKEGI